MRSSTLSLRPATIAAGFIALVSVLPATTGHASGSGQLTVRGSYQHVVASSRGHGADVDRDFIVADGRVYQLPLGSRGAPVAGADVTADSPLTATTASDTEAAPASKKGSTSVTTTSVTTPLATTAQHVDHVLVILATWTSPDAVTQQQAQQQFFTTDNAWFEQVSYGAYGLTGDVTPWVTIAGPDDGLCFTNQQQILDQASTAAQSLGYSRSNYDRTVVYFPRSSSPDCAGYAGWADVPGNTVWLNGQIDTGSTVHEIAHNLGLHHSHGFICSDASGGYIEFSSTCHVDEYGDVFDSMGTTNYAGEFNAPQKAALGWGADRMVDLSTSGSTALAPLNSTSGTVAAKITVGATTFWVEWRSRVGVDASLPAQADTGVLVHATDAAGTGLLDMTPDSAFGNAPLLFGDSWHIPGGPWVNVGQPSGNSLPISVTAKQARARSAHK
jgi:hypothetical protein